MKVLVISDSHGNLVNLKHILDFAERYGISRIIHAGDWNTLESVETVLSYRIPLYTVLGNADVKPEVVKKLENGSKKFAEDFLIMNFDGRNIGITHKPSDNKKYFLNEKLNLIINGHLHSKYESIETPVKIIRPGAAIQGSNFAVYDTASDKIEFIENDQI